MLVLRLVEKGEVAAEMGMVAAVVVGLVTVVVVVGVVAVEMVEVMT